MNWLKLLQHDLRYGLIRWRYLLIFLLFVLPCITCYSDVQLANVPGTWMDYMLYCFKGSVPITSSSEISLALPIFWIMAVAGSLLLNLDYFLSDLTQAGQQIIIRSKTRRGWYLSKCAWNLCSCIVYMVLVCASVLLFTLLSGGDVSLQSTPGVMEIHFSELTVEPTLLSGLPGLIVVVLMPLVTLMALNMLQMAVCLLMRPIIGFLISIAILVLCVYCNIPFVLGNGAMAIRSALLVPDGISPGFAALTAVAILLASAIMGSWRFQHTDILGLEE